MFELLREGLRIFSRKINVNANGWKKYPGNDKEICKEIINRCYDSKNRYFRTSVGNYTFFYARDFGWCTEPLINLGYKKEVDSTLKYALKIYEKDGQITVAINDKKKAFNFPEIYSPDSVAYIFRSLRIAKSRRLIEKYSKFLNVQVKEFEREVLKDDGMLLARNFSGMRDYIRETRLCYDMTMACMLCDEINRINDMMGHTVIDNVLKKHNLKSKLLKNYWNGKYFIDGPNDKYCSGHANTYPYYLDVISDRKMLKSSIKSMQDANLDKPFPLKYGYSKNTKFIWLNIFAKDWEKDTMWAMLGMAYINIIMRVDKDKAALHIEQYKKNILNNHCFIEVYSGFGPYKSSFYAADDSMLWASMYLDLKNKLKS